MVKAIIFDLFETLVTEANVKKMSGVQIAEKLKLSVGDYYAEVGKYRECRYRGAYPDFREVLREITDKLGVPVDEAVIEELNADRISGKSACFKEVPGKSIALLKSIRSKGIKTVLISNASVEEIDGFHASDLPGYFDEVLFSCDVGLIKPEKEIYLEAAGRIGVSAKECIFIGDGGSDELNGAAKVGMLPIRADWFTKAYGQLKPTIYRTYSQVEDLVKEIESDSLDV
ncbi:MULTISPECIES: HAD family hydrolase [unclassified Fusibacter]|uniref:HAD family hydrolase n=1 Tax=unclassified Fusibacter TaxID=2624464 RepID=UPI001010EF2A|nr:MULTISPECIES: HAD-IA family hydrolase [unclassified Fusibacter]MCK8059590.1 HAD-IA family hydrolase [Fusibacter sp. A2]NPE21391.1 HAD-IA family hydrolase [Fusibacter sp. A1]RXV61807.1 HAD family hydrolase [Fusibacter sp. A1]